MLNCTSFCIESVFCACVTNALNCFTNDFWNIYVSRSRNFPATNTKPVVTVVSQATRAFASFDKIASKIESEIWSQILSGCPSVTDSDVNR